MSGKGDHVSWGGSLSLGGVSMLPGSSVLSIMLGMAGDWSIFFHQLQTLLEQIVISMSYLSELSWVNARHHTLNPSGLFVELMSFTATFILAQQAGGIMEWIILSFFSRHRGGGWGTQMGTGQECVCRHIKLLCFVWSVRRWKQNTAFLSSVVKAAHDLLLRAAMERTCLLTRDPFVALHVSAACWKAAYLSSQHCPMGTRYWRSYSSLQQCVRQRQGRRPEK